MTEPTRTTWWQFWKRTPITAKDKDGDTALILASRSGDVDSLAAILANGADIEARGPYGMTALMEAAHRGKTECVKALIAAGADVNAKASSGRAALAWACELKRTGSVNLLIAAGANVNATDDHGETALMAACTFIDGVPLNEEIVTLLLDSGADPNLETRKGETALSRVFYFDHLDWAPQFTALLIKRGANQIPGKSTVCPECGSPKSLQMKKRGIKVTFHGTDAEFPCPHCQRYQIVSLHSISRDKGCLVNCASCQKLSIIPAAVWCKTCGDGLSSGWQRKISKC
jgi:Ankyrin repeats (3 copies)/Ankyrin repeat